MNSLLVTGIALTVAALLFAIIATAIPFWWRVSAHGWDESINFGLFQYCRHYKTDDVCASYSIVSDWLRAVQALMIMCILALTTSLGLSIMFGFVMKDKTAIVLGAAFMAKAAAFMGLLGIIIYAAKMSDPQDMFIILTALQGGLHAGFGLAVAAVVLAIIATVVVFLSRNSN